MVIPSSLRVFLSIYPDCNQKLNLSFRSRRDTKTINPKKNTTTNIIMSILLTNDLDKKRFASAITNICKSTIHRDASIQREAILQKVFSKSKMTTEEQNNFLDNLTKLLSLATKKGWTHQELTDATKNTELVTIAEEQGDILGQFWKSESININVSIAEASTFAQKLETFTWRIDMKSSGGDGSNDEPCALLEMNVTDRVRCCWICWLSVVILCCFCVWQTTD